MLAGHQSVIDCFTNINSLFWQSAPKIDADICAPSAHIISVFAAAFLFFIALKKLKGFLSFVFRY